MADPIEVWGTGEIARAMRVNQATVRTWRRREGFPAPLAIVAGRELWNAREVRAWRRADVARRRARRAEQHQVQIPITKKVEWLGGVLEVEQLPNGGRALTHVDPVSGTVQVFPLGPDVAREIGNKLFSAVPIAKAGEMPKGARR